MCPQLEVCKEQVEWARSEKRTFLRQRIEARLANLYLGSKDFSSALALISRLLSEVILLFIQVNVFLNEGDCSGEIEKGMASMRTCFSQCAHCIL